MVFKLDGCTSSEANLLERWVCRFAWAQSSNKLSFWRIHVVEDDDNHNSCGSNIPIGRCKYYYCSWDIFWRDESHTLDRCIHSSLCSTCQHLMILSRAFDNINGKSKKIGEEGFLAGTRRRDSSRTVRRNPNLAGIYMIWESNRKSEENREQKFWKAERRNSVFIYCTLHREPFWRHKCNTKKQTSVGLKEIDEQL